MIVKIAKYIGFCVYRGSYLLWPPVIVGFNPFRTAVPLWGQTTPIPSNMSPIAPKTRLQS